MVFLFPFCRRLYYCIVSSCYPFNYSFLSFSRLFDEFRNYEFIPMLFIYTQNSILFRHIINVIEFFSLFPYLFGGWVCQSNQLTMETKQNKQYNSIRMARVFTFIHSFLFSKTEIIKISKTHQKDDIIAMRSTAATHSNQDKLKLKIDGEQKKRKIDMGNFIFHLHRLKWSLCYWYGLHRQVVDEEHDDDAVAVAAAVSTDDVVGDCSFVLNRFVLGCWWWLHLIYQCSYKHRCQHYRPSHLM